MCVRTMLKTYLARLVGTRLNWLYKRAPQKAVQKSLQLFITPRKGRIKLTECAFLAEAADRQFEVGGVAIQTYLWKKGAEKVLLIHGWESNTLRWKSLIEQLLAQNYTVISLDAPAHGNSGGNSFGIPDYAEALKKVVAYYKPDYAVGHSMGGTTLLLQQQKGLAIKKMVLLAPATEEANLLQGFQQKLRIKQPLMQAFTEELEAKFGYEYTHFSWHKHTHDFTIPALFIHDTEDQIVPYIETENLIKQHKNSSLFTTTGLGHSLYSECINDEIIKFIKP